MYAIYTGRLAHIIEDLGDEVEIEFADGQRTVIAYGAATLVIDPTDDQVAAARAGLPIPRDLTFEREVRAEALEWLARSAADPSLTPEARAHAKELMAEGARAHLEALRETRR